ncbi:MAG: hypothetical protein ABL951_03405 [Alphaproteobacteria bacterium]
MQKWILGAMIFLLISTAFDGPANAACDQKTVYGALLNRYLFQDTGFVGYDDPVFQGGVTLSCDSGWLFDVFNSSALSTKGQYGQLDDRDFADEFDFTVAQNAEFGTPLGAFQYQIFASYYVLSDFNQANDDILELRIELARAFKLPGRLNNVSIAPFVRVMEFVGFGVYRDQMIIRSGVRTSIVLTDKFSFSSALAISSDPRTGIDVFRSETGLSFIVNKELTVFTEWQTAEGAKSAGLIGFSRSF